MATLPLNGGLPCECSTCVLPRAAPWILLRDRTLQRMMRQHRARLSLDISDCYAAPDLTGMETRGFAERRTHVPAVSDVGDIIDAALPHHSKGLAGATTEPFPRHVRS